MPKEKTVHIAKRNCHYCIHGKNTFYPRPKIDKIEFTICTREDDPGDHVKLTPHEVKGLTNVCWEYIEGRVRLRDGNSPSQINARSKTLTIFQ